MAHTLEWHTLECTATSTDTDWLQLTHCTGIVNKDDLFDEFWGRVEECHVDGPEKSGEVLVVEADDDTGRR